MTVDTRQGPSVGKTAHLDHLLTYVPSLDAAALAFARMGFTLSPRSSIDSMGISNHLVLMNPMGPSRANFIELMSPHDSSRLGATMRDVLSGPAGIRSMVLATENIADLYHRMRALGLDACEPVHAKREWKIPGESSVFPEFEVVLPVEAPLRFNACRYLNVELYLRPDWRNHPNGALRVAHCFAVAEDPASLENYAVVFGRPARRCGDGVWIFPTGEIDLAVLPPDVAKQRFGLARLPEAGPAYLGYEIQVASLERLRSHLLANDVPFQSHPGALSVSPEMAFGNLLWFSEDGRGAEQSAATP